LFAGNKSVQPMNFFRFRAFVKSGTSRCFPRPAIDTSKPLICRAKRAPARQKFPHKFRALFDCPSSSVSVTLSASLGEDDLATTAPAAHSARSILHVRGSWPAREDRIPSVVWLGILWLGMSAGFGLDFHRFARETPPPPKVLWVHAFVFTVWMFVVTAQVLLVLRNRVAWHRKFGWFAVGWAASWPSWDPGLPSPQRSMLSACSTPIRNSLR
jgi:hypothetical protein